MAPKSFGNLSGRIRKVLFEWRATKDARIPLADSNLRLMVTVTLSNRIARFSN